MEIYRYNGVFWAPPDMFSLLNVTLEHKTSLKGQFCEIEIYTSSEAE